MLHNFVVQLPTDILPKTAWFFQAFAHFPWRSAKEGVTMIIVRDPPKTLCEAIAIAQ